jgi:hypothetical protein
MAKACEMDRVRCHNLLLVVPQEGTRDRFGSHNGVIVPVNIHPSLILSWWVSKVGFELGVVDSLGEKDFVRSNI